MATRSEVLKLVKAIYLKPANIVIFTKQSLESLDGFPNRVPRTEGHAHVDQGFDSVRAEQAELPGD